MRVLFVLCSRNGGARLSVCLDYINSIETVHDLVISLVDNNSTDNTWHIYEDFIKKSKFQAYQKKVFRPGNSAGRNDAIEGLEQELIIFIDDDCYVEKDIVDRWVEVFHDNSIGYGSGMIKPFSTHQSDMGCRVTPDLEMIEAYQAVPRGLVQGSNMAFRTECLRAAGLFDERFGAGTRLAGEEWDVAIRASNAGWRGGYFPTPCVFHDHGRHGSEASRRDDYYSFGGGAVYAKNLTRRFRGDLFLLYLKELKNCGWRRRQNFFSGSLYFLIFCSVVTKHSGMD